MAMIPNKFKSLRVSWDPAPEMEVVKQAYPETRWRQQAKAIAYNNTWIVVYHNAHTNGWSELFGAGTSLDLKNELYATLEQLYLGYLEK